LSEPPLLFKPPYGQCEFIQLEIDVSCDCLKDRAQDTALNA
jgi:hypothetical protein